MSLLEEALRQIVPADGDAMAAAQKRWDSVAKPLGSLGMLEKSVVRMAGITGS
ncbi:MAG: nicotinate-nucleotide--dimethylbenzimidazole phosphoribosyltransferase, partial [Oscillospiraceae bacterium]